MADKAFGVKDINLIGASGTPTIESPNNLNINAVNVAISTDITVAGKVSLGAGTSISSPGSNILTLGTNSLERVRITSAGLVGIGTDAPSGKLNIVGSDTQLLNLIQNSGDLAIRLNDRGVGSAYIKVRDNTSGSLSFDTGGSERLRIDSSGRTGINTDTFNDAAEALRVQAPSGQNNTHLTIKAGSTSGYSVLNFGDDDFNEGRIKYNHSNNTMEFFVDDTSVFNIDSNGYRSFSTQPYVLLRKDGTTVNITADAIVEFDSTVTSEGGMTVNSSKSRITVPKAGKYAVLGAVAGSNTTVSVGDGWRLDLYRDGAVYANAYTYPINTTGASTGEEYTLQTSLIVPADANDYFEFKVASVGSARASVRYGYFCVYYLG